VVSSASAWTIWPRKLLRGSSTPTSTSTRIPYRGRLFSALVSLTTIWKRQSAATGLVADTSTKKKFSTITSSKKVASIPSTTVLPSGSRKLSSAGAKPLSSRHASTSSAIRTPSEVANRPFRAAT
jgi:hypothetical protein